MYQLCLYHFRDSIEAIVFLRDSELTARGYAQERSKEIQGRIEIFDPSGTKIAVYIDGRNTFEVVGASAKALN